MEFPILVCEHCKENFAVTYAPSQPRRFCSRSCADLFRNKKISKSCVTCGTEFLVSPSQSKKRFCKRTCFRNTIEYTEEVLQNISIGTKLGNSKISPEIELERRRKQIETNKTPGSKALRTAKNKKQWKDPAYRKYMEAVLKEQREKPGIKEKAQEALLKYWRELSPEDKQSRILTMLTNRPNQSYNTSIEIAVAEELCGLGIDFIPQHPVGTYSVDFLLPKLNLALEAMGCYYHKCAQCEYFNGSHEKHLYDSKRRNFIENKGYKVAWIWEHEVNSNAKEAVTTALRSVA